MRGGGSAHVVFVERDVVDQVELGGVAQRLVGAREVEIAGTAGREIHLDHGGQRHADQQLEAMALGLDECVDLDVGRDVVRGCGQRERTDERPHDGRRAAPHKRNELAVMHAIVLPASR